MQIRSSRRGTGAGIAWRTDGRILMNAHVIGCHLRPKTVLPDVFAGFGSQTLPKIPQQRTGGEILTRILEGLFYCVVILVGFFLIRHAWLQLTNELSHGILNKCLHHTFFSFLPRDDYCSPLAAPIIWAGIGAALVLGGSGALKKHRG